MLLSLAASNCGTRSVSGSVQVSLSAVDFICGCVGCQFAVKRKTGRFSVHNKRMRHGGDQRWLLLLLLGFLSIVVSFSTNTSKELLLLLLFRALRNGK